MTTVFGQWMRKIQNLLVSWRQALIYFVFFMNNEHFIVPGQEKVYKCLGTDVLTNAFNGYNACLFAYGQTGKYCNSHEICMFFFKILTLIII